MAIHAPLPPGPRTNFLRLATFRELRTDPLEFLTKLTQKYGDVSTFKTIGQRYVVLSHPDLVREVLLVQADAFFKGPALRNSRGLLGDGLLTAEGETHRLHRRLLTPAFHAKHVETYTPDILSSTRDLLAEWTQSTAAGPVTSDIRPHTMGLTLVIAAKTLFGTNVSKTDIATVHRCMDDLMSNYLRAVVPWGWILNLLPLATTRKLARARSDLHGLIGRIIAEKKATRGAAGEDLLSQMLAATDVGEPEAEKGCPFHGGGGGKKAARLTDAQLRDHAITILTAGHETTANALAFTLYLLAKHPDEQEKVRKECLEVLGSQEPTPEAVDRLPLTHNVLAESMRLLPPAWTLGRQNQRELVLNGYRIPNKSTVLIPQWTLHKDPRFWKEPERFWPDRWMEPEHPRFAYFPFSTGPRNCIGEAFAWLEMLLVLPMLVREFTFSLPATAPATLALTPAITLRPKHPVPLVIAPRNA